ncbi:MAG TPA: RES family NAD+ phosphorylase [Steroidobacter sp.]|nr:RES family NAD+ phosphorylase [Steroidobacteraceae bacterium]HLS81860.1 RES family NAD+ phosphorylase [Steroidobacter sp.]
MAEPRAVTLRWRKIYRTVAAKHPPVNVFEHIVDPQQMEAAWYIESLTNDRLRDESGVAPVVPEADRVRGPNASIVMAAFTHIGWPSRFSDGSYGVYYAARSLETSIRETAYHRGKFLAATREPACEIDMRAYVSRPLQPFTDIRAPRYRRLHDPQDYAFSQEFARSRRDKGDWGLVYRSVRHQGGECVAAFKPRAVSNPVAGPALAYVWDGERIARVYEKSEVLFEL